MAARCFFFYLLNIVKMNITICLLYTSSLHFQRLKSLRSHAYVQIQAEVKVDLSHM